MPAFLLRRLLGDLADELLLGGQRVLPDKADATASSSGTRRCPAHWRPSSTARRCAKPAASSRPYRIICALARTRLARCGQLALIGLGARLGTDTGHDRAARSSARSSRPRSRGPHDHAVPTAHVGTPGGRLRCVCGAGRGPDLSEPDRASRGLLCAGRHRRHRRAAHFGPARRRARPDRGGGEPRRRQRIDRRPERGLAPRPTATRCWSAAGGSGDQPALDQGSHLRSGQGLAAGRARHRRAACVGHSRRRRPTRRCRTC